MQATVGVVLQKKSIASDWYPSALNDMVTMQQIICRSELTGFNLSIVINKNVWIKSFSAGVPTEAVLKQDIHRLLQRLKKFDADHNQNKKSAHSRLSNSLQRRQKMLAAVQDGQPWAWMLYPSSFST